ncbi:MAG TPA: YciI family protein [Nocardioides sp.]|jgi:uncharacterized protein YciI|uniref:YciI family protein n=1 Tax=Nocardioides sp. TaxID=35761 RepID=UPI002E2FCD8B|nr:YciI family protein [Nocardioides sp.]HEX3929900.1 YciI family protein [Nocardioides sp.]
MELESYSFVLLRSGPRSEEYDADEADRLQVAHLAHLDRMRAAGKLLLAGPFSNRTDETLRGLCVYACELDEARTLAESDPAVRAGRLSVEMMTWWARRGAVTFHPEVVGD